MALIQVASLLGYIDGLSGCDVLEVDDGVGHAALGSDRQAFEVNSFIPIRGADLGVLGDGKVQFFGYRSRPFHCPGDRSTVRDRDDLITALRGGKGSVRQKKQQYRTTCN